jgi:precorrin-2 dehydrogenase/sirohydrochlorin ferrochelatase
MGPMFYPIFLNLKGKRVVVIGGGEIAERKVESLLGTGASVIVVSPAVTPGLAALAGQDRILLRPRPYATGDCDGAALVLSATDDAELSRKVFEEAGASGALVNTADQPGLCDFFMPAIVRRGRIAIAISTGGASPALAAQLRHKISEVVEPEYAQLADLLSSVRNEIRSRIPGESERKALYYRILESDIIECLKRNDMPGAVQLLHEIIGGGSL